MAKIVKLTTDQQGCFPEFVAKWIEIGLSTRPADRPRAERAISGLYRLAKLKEPRIIWLPCPISAALSAVCYAKLIQHRLVEQPSKKPAVRSAVRSAVGSAVRSAVDSAVGSAVDSAVGSAVRSAVGSAVRSAVRSAVDSAVDSAVRSAVDSAVRSAVDSAVGSAVYSAVGSAVRSAVRSAVDSAVRSAVDSAVGSAVYSAVGSAVRSAVRSAVDSAVDSAVYSAVGSAVGSAVDSAVGSAVRSAVGSAVRSAVDSAVGSAVYSAVGSAVRSAVGSAVRSAVDSAVGSAVYSAVDSAVRSAVRSAVDSAGRAFFGGALYNAGYSAWADYFNEVCGIAIDRNFLEMTESCGFYWTLDGICFASERPSEIHLDAEGRLHSETGMSIRYGGTGWGLFHWHGTQVPREWIADRAKLTPTVALKQTNVEQRRAACEILGWVNILRELKAKTIDSDNDPEIGTLVQVKLPDLPEPAKFLRVQCGTGREFAIGIPPHINKALDAQAWIIGLDPEDFTPPEIRA